MKIEMKIATEAALTAGDFMMTFWNREIEIEYKGDVDLVSHVDRGAESLILECLHKAFPGDCIIGEESDGYKTNSSRVWIVDPLDGTTNFAHGLPHFCVSIGLVIDDMPTLGVIYDPTKNFLFTGIVGHGCFLNSKPIQVSDTDKIERALLATGFPYDRRTNPNNNTDRASHILKHCQGLRRAGAAALDLAYVAAGWIDGYWEDKLHPWDVAAGYALVNAAGGKVSDFKGNPVIVQDRQCVATNSLIHQQLLGRIQEGSTYD